MTTRGTTYPATPMAVGSTDRTNDPEPIATRPARVARAAPKRSTVRPAGTPASAATTGPADIARPTRAVSSARPRERWNGPTTRVAIITVATSALMARLP